MKSKSEKTKEVLVSVDIRNVCQLQSFRKNQSIWAISNKMERIGFRKAETIACRHQPSDAVADDSWVWQNAMVEAGYSFKTIAPSPYGTLPIDERVVLSSISC